MLLSHSLLRSWRNPLATIPPFHQNRIPPSSSPSSVRPQPWDHTIFPAQLASRHRTVPGVEAEESEEELVEDEDNEAETKKFVEVGYISSVHGLQGEVRVRSSTSFPEVRFAEPGVRWLRSRVSGSEELRPVELLSGRSHSGLDSWILSFGGISTVDEARQLIGSTILIREDDRPDLEEGEFYTPDLYGMKVILKETGQEVGTVINVVNYGSSDLLQVKLAESSGSPLAWVPFVEAIVPDVDIDKREMFITPPKGLLELNIRSDARSKKERRLMEWKQRKKAQQNLSIAKKGLSEMGQDHVLRCLASGGKDGRKALQKQIRDINFRLFRHALENITERTERTPSFGDSNSYHSTKIYREIPGSYLNSSGCEASEDIQELKSDGLRLLSESNMAVICIPGVENNENEFIKQFRDALSEYRTFMEVGRIKKSPPLIIISPTKDYESDQSILSDIDDFGFEKERVWVFEEDRLPVLKKVDNNFKILMKSPWEVIESNAGPGTLFSSLSSLRILDRLNELGVNYVQISSLGPQCFLADPLFLGFVASQKVYVGMKIFANGHRGEINMIFSMEYLNKLAKEEDKLLRFHTVPMMIKHVDLHDNNWVTVEPTEPNSCYLYCPIDEVMNSLSADDAAILKIVD